MIAVLGAGLLAACGGNDDNTENDAETAAAAEATAADSVTVADTWARATDEDMSAVFGILENGSDTDAVVVSAESDLATMELHEVVDEDGEMVMQEVPGGFTVPADGSRELEPGGDHLMLLGLTEPIVAGDEITVALGFEDGSELEFTTVAKEFEGGDEDYEPGGMDDM
ncbi:copper chaperone PCu(A)C [Glycomyces albus]